MVSATRCCIASIGRNSVQGAALLVDASDFYKRGACCNQQSMGANTPHKLVVIMWDTLLVCLLVRL
jgi:hypothetical protein